MRALLLLLFLAGCRQKSAPPDPCAQLTPSVIQGLVDEWAKAHDVALPTVKAYDAIIATCKRDRWTQPIVEARRVLDSILPTHVGAAPVDGGLPEAGPHPDYPTPVAAGTANIFFLEDPERGPPLPKKAGIPPRGSLTWTTHAYCSLARTSYACSRHASGTGLSSFRVGKKGDTAVLEEMYGDRLVATTVYTTEAGAPKQRVTLDARGRIVDALMFDKGKLSGRLRNGGNALDGCGYLAYTPDAGQGSKLTCLQWLGEPMLDTAGVATYVTKRDQLGFITEEASFGIDGKPILDNTGKHKYVRVRDAYGRPFIDRYFDLDGKRVADPDGCAGERTEYEADGRPSRVICIDEFDVPRGRSNGVAILELLYDARGCQIGSRNLDPAGKPTPDPDGIHGDDRQVDRHCVETRRTCVDVRGEAIACGPGKPAQYRTRLDGAGNAVSVTHYTADGTPTVDEEFDSFELRYRYDAVGNVIAMSCFAAGGDPIECDGTGFHQKLSTWDANGRRIGEAFTGTDGRRAFNLGATTRKFKYDAYDHPFESQSFDGEGQLVEQSGTATIRELYDVRHQRFAIVLLNVDGKPAHYTACFTGATCPSGAWHAVRIVRLGDGTVEYNQFFDEDGQLIEAISCRTNKCFD